MTERSSLIAALNASSAPPYTMERTTQALALCEQLLKQDSNDLNLRATMGSLLARVERWQEALPHLAAAVAAAPQHVHLRATVGLAYFHCRIFDKAAEHLLARLKLTSSGAGLAIGPTTVEYASLLGAAFLNLGQFDQAAALFDAVISERAQAHQHRPPTVHADLADVPSVSIRRPSRILYLPVEVKARELQAKAWLADAAVAAGFSVVIGSSWNIQLQGGADLPPGIVLFKTLNHLDAANMRRFKAAGHVIAALDEEAFGRSTDETTLRLNVHPDALRETDLVMVQGAAQRNLMATVFPEAADKVIVTGTPRADIFARGLAHGEAKMCEPSGYVLICLMSGNVNGSGRNFAVCTETTLGLGGIPLDSPLGRSYVALFRQATAFELAIMPQIADVIREVASAFPERRIVVRPHPVEDARYWEKIVHGLANVTLRADGALTEWLGGAAAMIYVSGCGAGFEAYLANVPAVRFEGDGRAKVPQSGISSALNVLARTPAQVVGNLRAMLSGETPKRTDTEKAIAATFLKQSDTPSAQSVITALSDLLARFQQAPTPREALHSLFKNRTQPFASQDFHLRKFPKTAVNDLAALIAQSRAARDNGTPARIFELDTNTFLVSPDVD